MGGYDLDPWDKVLTPEDLQRLLRALVMHDAMKGTPDDYQLEIRLRRMVETKVTLEAPPF